MKAAQSACFPAASPDQFLRIFPGLYQGDGFFAACITRSSSDAL